MPDRPAMPDSDEDHDFEDRVRAYYRLHGRGQSLVDSTGRVYGHQCGECGWDKRHWKDDGELWVCGHCGAPWSYQDVEVLKGEVCRASRLGRPIPAPRPGEFDSRLARWVHFGQHLNAMLRDRHWRWRTQVLVAHALTPRSYAEIAEHANTHDWPTRAGSDWTAARARKYAHEARQELRRRLRSSYSAK